MTANSPAVETLLKRRVQRLGPNVSTFYEEPVHLVKGEGAWVWDKAGRRYLDCYNNVAHVGHCHPKVVEAICQQANTLNTHTRYLHEGILDYADRLTATFAEPFSSVIMTCSGSEANDIALRMAQAVTGKTGIIATDHTYHGNTESVSRLSRTNPPIGGGADRVAYVPAPDSYRPLGGEAGMAHAHAFASAVEEKIAELESSGVGFSGMILCPYFANEGFPDLPMGWLAPTVEVIRKAGGVIIADEVQPGFGRTGTHMWAHQRMGFTPDIITLGKPMGNGHPVAGLVTSPEILATFRNSFRYFNTFGGNPVSCAAAMATLKVVQEEQLMENARDVGEYARQGLSQLAQKYDCIGDVRGSGLFFGAEMVLDKASKAPATEFTQRVVNGMRQQGVLINKLGIHYNVLKVRPPMVFGRAEADVFLQTLDAVLAVTPLEA
ncbi:aspartate aminotransferase family protein [Leucothrix mucor]|uniref:aspartate aminotransferase family protein n=1 Tax=Leucothrix mucor TaxID=45248 RepID=UPI0003B562E8|nr:aminotransferase class III-fold pyridoxal phosphate-dependent enzyme [Leucothrix mucor]